jgi:hypothetical protein
MISWPPGFQKVIRQVVRSSATRSSALLSSADAQQSWGGSPHRPCLQPAGRGERPTAMKAEDRTHPLTAARPLTHAVAALTCALAMASGLAAAGCAGSPARAWSPARAGSLVPAVAIPRLAVIGGRAAKASGDAAPLQMTAVLTTHAKALTSATPGDFVSGAGDVPVFLVTMRGNFVATGASLPPGAAEPAGRYLSIVVDARTFQVLDSGLSPGPPPVSPASLGPVTYLAGHPY